MQVSMTAVRIIATTATEWERARIVRAIRAAAEVAFAAGNVKTSSALRNVINNRINARDH